DDRKRIVVVPGERRAAGRVDVVPVADLDVVAVLAQPELELVGGGRRQVVRAAVGIVENELAARGGTQGLDLHATGRGGVGADQVPTPHDDRVVGRRDRIRAAGRIVDLPGREIGRAS